MENDVRCGTNQCLGNVKPNARSPYCGKCRSRRFRARHKVKALFAICRYNASKRGIDWLITLDEWIIICAETNYHKLVGPHAHQMTLDRKNHFLPYTYDNVQVITKEENSKKSVKEKKEKLKHYPQTLKGHPDVPF